MALAAGTRLGPYAIVSPLGSGGMGEVYRATDTKLGRDVAIKTLPADLAADAERLARFEREARTLATLNHPQIAQVYGFEESGDSRALVMELVEGDDLAQRIARGPVPLDEALPIARQIAEALEAAHDAGIIHRDLKPANIKVRPDGTVKVLDFGLAKAVEQAQGAGLTAQGLASAPTLTSPVGVTAHGMILGTAAYMAPEQARGKAVDKRADIWAFGVVLYEMLTGRRAFSGDDISEVLAAVLRDTPAFDALPATTPGAVRRLIARCLERDPKLRLRDIGEARIALNEAARTDTRVDAPSGDAAPATHPPALGPRRGGRARGLPWALAAISLALAGWALLGQGGEVAAPLRVQRFDTLFPPDVEPTPTTEGGVGLSPDGQVVAMTGVKNGSRTVFVRRLDSEEVTEVPATGVTGSAFSPDSTRLAFLGGGRLRSFSLADGEVKTLASGVSIGGGLAWGEAGVVFARESALWIVPSEGGEARRLTTLDTGRQEVAHTGPIVLPGGRTVLFTCLTPEPGTERIEAVPAAGGARTIVLERASTPVWSPTGHLLFTRDGAVLATAFDPVKASVQGSPTPVFPAGQIAAGISGTTALWVASNGTLLVVPYNSLSKRVVSVAREGSARALELPSGNHMNPRVSPDGRRVMVSTNANVLEAWNLERQSRERLVAPAPGTTFSIWSRDGRQIVLRRFNVPMVTPADGSGRLARVPGATANDYPSGPGPGADTFLVSRVQPDSTGDIYLLSATGAFEPKRLVATDAYEGGAQLSPDERWLVYGATEAGRSVILLRRYPELDRQWQVSEGPGLQARWSADGREIYYRDGASVLAVAFDGSRDEPIIGKAIALFKDDYDFGQGVTIANYDVTRDGRFLMLRREAQTGQLHIVLNWTEELKQILAKGGVR